MSPFVFSPFVPRTFFPAVGLPLPRGGGSVGRFFRLPKVAKRALKFTPGLTSVGLKIFGKKPSTITGLGIRPIPLKYKPKGKGKKKKKFSLGFGGNIAL